MQKMFRYRSINEVVVQITSVLAGGSLSCGDRNCYKSVNFNDATLPVSADGYSGVTFLRKFLIFPLRVF